MKSARLFGGCIQSHYSDATCKIICILLKYSLLLIIKFCYLYFFSLCVVVLALPELSLGLHDKMWVGCNTFVHMITESIASGYYPVLN